MRQKHPKEEKLALLHRMSSHDDENDTSKQASTQHHHDPNEANTISLFRGGDIDEIEDTVLEEWVMENGNPSLSSAICSFLSCSKETGPTVQ